MLCYDTLRISFCVLFKVKVKIQVFFPHKNTQLFQHYLLKTIFPFYASSKCSKLHGQICKDNFVDFIFLCCHTCLLLYKYTYFLIIAYDKSLCITNLACISCNFAFLSVIFSLLLLVYISI